MEEKKYRIIKSGGRQYVQEVKYRWDADKKIGRTKVIKHMGPLKQLTLNNYTIPQLKSIRGVLSRRKKKKGNRTRKEIPMKKSVESNDLSAELPPLTPPSEVVDGVKNIIKNAERPMSRLEVYHEYKKLYPGEVLDSMNLKTQIGFALTILDRKGKISKAGKGIRGDPFQYRFVK